MYIYSFIKRCHVFLWSRSKQWLHSWPTLCDPMDSSMRLLWVHGILHEVLTIGCYAFFHGIVPFISSWHIAGLHWHTTSVVSSDPIAFLAPYIVIFQPMHSFRMRDKMIATLEHRLVATTFSPFVWILDSKYPNNLQRWFDVVKGATQWGLS